MADLDQHRPRNHNSKVAYSVAPRRKQVRAGDCSQHHLHNLRRVGDCSVLQRHSRPVVGYLEQLHYNQQLGPSLGAHRHSPHRAVDYLAVQHPNQLQAVVYSAQQNRNWSKQRTSSINSTTSTRGWALWWRIDAICTKWRAFWNGFFATITGRWALRGHAISAQSWPFRRFASSATKQFIQWAQPEQCGKASNTKPRSTIYPRRFDFERQDRPRTSQAHHQIRPAYRGAAKRDSQSRYCNIE